jgi:putative tricarboxylic transport membrane protein
VDKSDLRKADLITGLLLIGGGAFAVVAGWTMPRSPRLEPTMAMVTSPGMLPLVCGVLLAIMGGYLVGHAVRAGGLLERADLGRALQGITQPDVRRMAVVTLLLAVFIFGLIGRMPYWAATMLYLAALMAYLRGASPIVTLILAAAIAVGVDLLFGELVRIPLP